MRRISFGLAIPPVLPAGMQLGLCRLAEALGFERVWFPDHLLYPDLMHSPDCWTVMTAAMTRTRRLVFGTAVSDPHRYHPAVLAQRLATMDQLSRGRLILGLGSGEAMNLDPFGIPWDRRVGRMRESLQVLRGLLDSNEPFTFEGDFFTLNRARLGVTPFRGRRIPIYLAALGPMMQKLCGRFADGWLPVSIPASHYREYCAPIDEAAKGRPIEKVAVVCAALTRHPERTLAMMRKFSLGLVWPPVLERMGQPLEPPGHLADFHYQYVNPCDDASRRRFEEFQEWLPHDVIEKFVVLGDVDQVIEAVTGYAKAGADHIKLVNASTDPTALVTLAAQVLPRFSGRPAPLWTRAANQVARVVRSLGLIPEIDPERGLAWLKGKAGHRSEGRSP